MTKTLALFTRVGRLASSTSSLSTSSTSTHRHASSTSTSTRNISTKTKSRGPAQPMLEQREQQQQSPGAWMEEYDNYPLPQLTTHQYALENCLKWPNNTAMECGLTGRSYTHGQIYDGVLRLGGALQQLSVLQGAETKIKEQGKGPTIALLMPNTPEYPIAFYGGMSVGGTVTTVNPAYTPAEIARHLKDSDTEVLVVESVLEPLADAALALLAKEKEGLKVEVMVNGPSQKGRPNIRDIIADTNVPFAEMVQAPLDSTAILPYSSGTTGLPKGVCVPHRALAASLHGYHHPMFAPITSAEGETQEVLLGLLPFYHVFGMAVIMTSGLNKGAKTITMPLFDPQAYAGILSKHKITRLHMVAPLIHFTAMSPAIPNQVLSSVKSVVSAATPMPKASAAILKEKIGEHALIQEGYGMTETMGTHFTPQNKNLLGGDMKSLPEVRVKVVDLETEEHQPPHHPGELRLMCPALMKGYYKNEQATRECFDEEGFLKTGDVAVYDEEGRFNIVDRIKELIKVKGIQVSPTEIENLLLRHPGVSEACVVGVPDEKAGEAPRAYIVPRSKDVKAEEVSAFVAAQVARHKHLLGGVRFVEELPRNQTGKLLRLQVRKMASEE